ncbi:MAG TPA: hypothetical protein VE398_10445, partial [Acidobacteriota bacterium]|nr:hypothetical protein [Acidobacteriota bacterium]
VAFFADSVGGLQGTLLAVVEKRIKAAILSSAGLQLTIPYLPEADPFNLVTRVTIPVLMLGGRYDATFPLESSQRPHFQFHGTRARDKLQVMYEAGPTLVSVAKLDESPVRSGPGGAQASSRGRKPPDRILYNIEPRQG